MTVEQAVREGFRIRRGLHGWELVTPFAGVLRCPSLRVALLTLCRVTG